MSLTPFFPGEIVIALDNPPALGRILPPFRQARAPSRDLLYSVEMLETHDVRNHILHSQLLPIGNFLPRGMPFRGSKYDTLFSQLLPQLYKHFELLKRSIFIPATAFPLGNYVEGDDEARDFIAAGLVRLQTLKNPLSLLGSCENKGSNSLAKSLIPPKSHKVVNFTVLEVGNAIKIGSFIGFVRRIYALHKFPFDNVYVEAELLVSRSEEYIMTGIVLQIPLIYEMQILQVVALFEKPDYTIHLPILFANEEIPVEARDTIYVTGIFLPDQQSEVCMFLTRLLAGECSSTEELEGSLMELDLSHVHHEKGLPQFDKEEGSLEYDYYLNRNISGFYLSKKIESEISCTACGKQIQHFERGYDTMSNRTINVILELNRVNGVLTCLQCQQEYHPSCYYSNIPSYMTEISELFSNGYSFTGINTRCQKCASQESNYYDGDNLTFWKQVLCNNYHAQPQKNDDKELHDKFNINTEDLENCLLNWHIMQVEEQFNLNYEDTLLSKLQRASFLHVTKDSKNIQIIINKSSSVLEPQSMLVGENCHCTQSHLVEVLSCLESYFEVESNMLYWLQIWYESTDFETFKRMEVEEVQEILNVKYGGSSRQPTRAQQQEQQETIKKIKKEEELEEEDSKRTPPPLKTRKTVESAQEPEKAVDIVKEKASESISSVAATQEKAPVEALTEPVEKPIEPEPQEEPEEAKSQISCNIELDDKGKIPEAQLEKVYEELKQRYEEQQTEELPEHFAETIKSVKGDTVVLHPPPIERQGKMTVPYDLEEDFTLLKTGVEQTLDMLQNPNDSELQELMESVMLDRSPRYDQLVAAENSEKFVSPTENLLYMFRERNFEALNCQSLIRFISSVIPLLITTSKQFPEQEQLRLSYFPVSRVLQREMCRRQILEMDERSEELQHEEHKLKLQNEDDISEIECIRTAFAELKARLVHVATQLEEREGMSKRIEAELRSLVEAQALLSQKYCEERPEDPAFVISDLMALREARKTLLEKISEEMPE